MSRARLQQLYGLGLSAQVLPALLLGVPLGSQLYYPPDLGRMMVLVALGCSLLSLCLAWQQSRQVRQQPDSRLSAALLLASATGVPLLLASVLWRQEVALWWLLPLAGLCWVVSWWWLALWANRKVDGESSMIGKGA